MFVELRNLISLDKVARYWRTLRHLKARQFYGRVWFRLYRPRVDERVVTVLLRSPLAIWCLPGPRVPSMLGVNAFRFLNREHALPAIGGWNDVESEKLWLYNLHYFDDLNAQNAGQRVEWHRGLIARWQRENPPSLGIGWESYPTSLRIVNWIKWLAVGNAPLPSMLGSLKVQAGWLAKRLEWHLLGNHLFANAKALVFSGLFFEGPQAAVWLATGLKIVTRELPEQVLADGGNFERSPMYHAVFLEDVLDLVNAAMHWPRVIPDAQVSVWRETAGRMLGWLAGMTHPDGEIALFNDAAFGIAPRTSELQSYAQRLGIESGGKSAPGGLELIHFSDSGYVRLQTPDAVALLDVAPIGPDYLPGHAHADTLSFELSVFRQRVVVNGGTSRYGLGPERLLERGTAAHSTVEVAGQDSSEVWGGFRVGRRAYPVDLQVQYERNRARVACSHDGYTRLLGGSVHRREWVLDANGLRVNDTVSGGMGRALARYILHPSVLVTPIGSNTWQLALAGGQNLRVVVSAGIGRIEFASYAPEFGMVMSTQCLVVELTQGQARLEWLWS